MAALKHSFGKAEKLCSVKEIENLYTSGKSFLIYPIVFYYQEQAEAPTRVLVSVPKRKHKRAVARNLLKRRMREAYRLNKIIQPPHFTLGLTYIAQQIHSYQEIEQAIQQGLKKLGENETAPAQP